MEAIAAKQAVDYINPLPMARIPVEAGWKITLGAWDAFRLLRGRLFIEALVRLLKGSAQFGSLEIRWIDLPCVDMML